MRWAWGCFVYVHIPKGVCDGCVTIRGCGGILGKMLPHLGKMRSIWAICTKNGQKCSRIGGGNSIILLLNYYFIITSLLLHYSKWWKQGIIRSLLRVMLFPFFHYYIDITHYYHDYHDYMLPTWQLAEASIDWFAPSFSPTTSSWPFFFKSCHSVFFSKPPGPPFFYPTCFWAYSLLQLYTHPFRLYKRSYQPVHTSPSAPPGQQLTPPSKQTIIMYKYI